MTLQERSDLIIKTIRWTAKAATSIQNAGGAVEMILEKFPDDLLVCLVSNSLNLTYKRVD